VQLAGIAPDVNQLWMEPIARNLTDAEEGNLRGKKYLIPDRDALFTAKFRSMRAEAGVASVKLPPKSPNWNAHAERFAQHQGSDVLGEDDLVR
jgi:hypothetical protein